MEYVLRHIPVKSYIQFAYRRMRHVPTYKHMCLYSSPFVKFTESKKRNNSHIGACAYKRGNTVYKHSVFWTIKAEEWEFEDNNIITL